MIDAANAVVWVDYDTKQVMVKPHTWSTAVPGYFRPWGPWADPIGAAYSEWQEGSDEQRVRLMLETVIDLAMQGFDLKTVLTAFAEVRQFRALGNESYPMCRALTAALIGHSLEFNTMSFEELLKHYAPRKRA